MPDDPARICGSGLAPWPQIRPSWVVVMPADPLVPLDPVVCTIVVRSQGLRVTYNCVRAEVLNSQNSRNLLPAFGATIPQLCRGPSPRPHLHHPPLPPARKAPVAAVAPATHCCHCRPRPPVSSATSIATKTAIATTRCPAWRHRRQWSWGTSRRSRWVASTRRRA